MKQGVKTSTAAKIPPLQALRIISNDGTLKACISRNPTHFNYLAQYVLITMMLQYRANISYKNV